MDKSPLLAKDLFVTLSFHAKLHALLDKFVPSNTDSEKERLTVVARDDTITSFERQLGSVIEKIEKKQLAGASPTELSKMRDAVSTLRGELEELKVKKEGRT